MSRPCTHLDRHGVLFVYDARPDEFRCKACGRWVKCVNGRVATLKERIAIRIRRLTSTCA